MNFNDLVPMYLYVIHNSVSKREAHAIIDINSIDIFFDFVRC